MSAHNAADPTHRAAVKKLQSGRVSNRSYLLLIRLNWLATHSHWPSFLIQVSVKRP
jgi:hypothetical protein